MFNITRIQKNLFRKGTTLFLTLALIMGGFSPAFAATGTIYDNDAVRLNRMGLFLGTGSGFELENSINRLQGAALFIRLMGEEEEALSENNPHPFQDVPTGWASPYVGQMYEQGYSNGVSEKDYGTGGMTADQFAAYVLRALGYQESSGDFVWSQSLKTLRSLHIITAEDYSRISRGNFTRDHAVRLSSAALDASMKGQTKTLYEKLLDQGAIQQYSNKMPDPVISGTPVASYDDMTRVFQRMRANLQYSATLTTQGVSLGDIKNWLDSIVQTSAADVWGWNLVSTYMEDRNYPIKVSIRWLYSDGYEVSHSILYPGASPELSTRNLEIRRVAEDFLSQYINPDMSDREKVKAVHDYLVRTVRYDSELTINLSPQSEDVSDSYMVYGALVNKVAVCDGYAKAFTMFMDILGIPSDRIVGLSEQNNRSVNHAWNRVYLEGGWKYIDVTWDDPVPDRGNSVQYDYFLVTEEKMDRDHSWEPDQLTIRYF